MCFHLLFSTNEDLVSLFYLRTNNCLFCRYPILVVNFFAPWCYWSNRLVCLFFVYLFLLSLNICILFIFIGAPRVDKREVLCYSAVEVIFFWVSFGAGSGFFLFWGLGYGFCQILGPTGIGLLGFGVSMDFC